MKSIKLCFFTDKYKLNAINEKYLTYCVRNIILTCTATRLRTSCLTIFLMKCYFNVFVNLYSFMRIFAFGLTIGMIWIKTPKYLTQLIIARNFWTRYILIVVNIGNNLIPQLCWDENSNCVSEIFKARNKYGNIWEIKFIYAIIINSKIRKFFSCHCSLDIDLSSWYCCLKRHLKHEKKNQLRNSKLNINNFFVQI